MILYAEPSVFVDQASRSRIPLVAKLTQVLEGYAYLTQSCAATEPSTFSGMRSILRMQQTQFLQKNSSPASFPILLLLHQYPLIEQFQHQIGSISLDLTRSERFLGAYCFLILIEERFFSTTRTRLLGTQINRQLRKDFEKR